MFVTAQLDHAIMANLPRRLARILDGTTYH
jgi:hypothetical protein